VTINVNFTDVGSQDTHTCTFSWDDGSPDTVVTAAGTGNGSCSATHPYSGAGVNTVTITVKDDDTGSAVATWKYVVIYDPNSGFVTGGGWINSPAGAYVPNLSLAGRANFGFVSKYQNGAKVPTGETEFNYQVGNMNFHSTSYDWLVVSGAMAQYKGSGTINGVSGYSFILTAKDGQIAGGGGTDGFRIKITKTSDGTVVYDNLTSADDSMTTGNTQNIDGGSIVIHSK
jgi:hypothetical protein